MTNQVYFCEQTALDNAVNMVAVRTVPASADGFESFAAAAAESSVVQINGLPQIFKMDISTAAMLLGHDVTNMVEEISAKWPDIAPTLPDEYQGFETSDGIWIAAGYARSHVATPTREAPAPATPAAGVDPQPEPTTLF